MTRSTVPSARCSQDRTPLHRGIAPAVRVCSAVWRAVVTLVLAGGQVVRAATPGPTQAPFVMGGGPSASQSGDPILALVAVVALGCLAATVTLVYVAVADHVRPRV